MSYHVGVCVLELVIVASHSLKEKRSVLKSLITRLRQQFNVSVAEVGYQDQWQRAAIAVSVVAGDRAMVDPMLEQVVRYVESNIPGQVTSVHKEIF